MTVVAFRRTVVEILFRHGFKVSRCAPYKSSVGWKVKPKAGFWVWKCTISKHNGSFAELHGDGIPRKRFPLNGEGSVLAAAHVREHVRGRVETAVERMVCAHVLEA